jgi:hypothetical protein
LRLRLLLLLGLLRLRLLLLLRLLLRGWWRLLRIGSLLLLLLLLLRLLRRLVRVPALRRSGLLVVHVAHGCCVWRQRRRSEAIRDGEVVWSSIAIGVGRMRGSTMA